MGKEVEWRRRLPKDLCRAPPRRHAVPLCRVAKDKVSFPKGVPPNCIRAATVRRVCPTFPDNALGTWLRLYYVSVNLEAAKPSA